MSERGKVTMRLAFRIASAALVAFAIFAASAEVPVEAKRARCYIDEFEYFADSSCVGPIGIVQRGCSGQVLNEWGTTSSIYTWYQWGGSGYCGCGGDTWEAGGSVGCADDR